MNKRVKPVKRALAGEYGFKNVSVRSGTGTASGWVEAEIKTKKPNSCTCSPDGYLCQECRDRTREIRQEAKKISVEALKKEGLEFCGYTAGDGYGTQRDSFLLQINLI